jgi:galactose mutarotase-like enzyme
VRIQKRAASWILTSGELQAEVVPAQGGKIRRLLSRPQGRNLFFTDPRPRFPRNPQGRYLAHDISGCDECFPTVAGFPGRFGQDHGLLWDQPWRAQRQGERLVAWATRPGKMPVQFIRQIWSPRPSTLRLEYTVVNLSTRSLPFLYSSHPILALEPESTLALPGVRQLRVLGHNGLLASGRSQRWPVARTRAGKTLRLNTLFLPEKKLAGKWFAPGKGVAQVTFPSIRRRLTLTWDRTALPYLGLWLSLGVPLDAKIPDQAAWVCAALEPCTLPQDACQPASANHLLPNEPFNFWIQWELSGY